MSEEAKLESIEGKVNVYSSCEEGVHRENILRLIEEFPYVSHLKISLSYQVVLGDLYEAPVKQYISALSLSTARKYVQSRFGFESE